MTSKELANVYERAEQRWLLCPLRRRLNDSERLKWKNRYCARAVTLLSRWRSAKPQQNLFIILSKKWTRDDEPLTWVGEHDIGYTWAVDATSQKFRVAGRFTADEAARICRHSKECVPVLLDDVRRVSYTSVLDHSSVDELVAAGRVALTRRP